MTTVDVLREARRLYALNPSHEVVPHFGTFCVRLAIDAAVGAVGVEWPEWRDLRAAATLAFEAATGSDQSIMAFNSKHSTDEVLAVFDKAIESVA